MVYQGKPVLNEWQIMGYTPRKDVQKENAIRKRML